MYLRRNSKTKLEVSIDEPLNVDWDGNELLLSDILGTDEDVIYRDMETEAEYSALQRGDREALQAGADNRTAAVWDQYAGRRGKDAERKWRICSVFPSPIFPGWKNVSSSDCEERLCGSRYSIVKAEKFFYFRKPRIAGARNVNHLR